MPSRRAPTRASLSSRTFWVVAVLFCIIESAMLLLAYQHTAAHRRLAEQLSFVRQGTVVAWHIAAGPSPEPRTEVPGIPAPRDARHRWLESVLQALADGGPVHTLDNTEVALTPLEDSGARRSLTEALARWTSFSRLETLDPGSPASVSEISTLAPALAELARQLSQQHREATQLADRLAALAIVTGCVAFVVMCATLLRQTRRSERSGRLMRSMMNQIGAGVCIVGSTNKIADANRAACRMLGRPRKALRGKRLEDILTEQEGVWTGERPDGMPLAIERIPGTIEGYNGPLRIVTLLDVTARHLTAECLQHLANHDTLTSLPNRGFLEGHFKKELNRCTEQGLALGVAVLDLDGFKPINDTYGHAVGDALLVQAAQRLSAALRNGDVIARVGGDEFVAIFPNINNRETLRFLGDRLLSVFAHPFQIQGHLIPLGGSVGLALAPEDGSDQDSLLRAADAAMYRAKHMNRRPTLLTSISGTGRSA
ncbi:sensor domain-containing diguanylate cyclase [Zoogloea sp.]|uniref:sensor domain-containing diguanylate cyclase n=1 Tax=Zoogloea sp. TaxID=49181 RepID=UPI0032202930